MLRIACLPSSRTLAAGAGAAAALLIATPAFAQGGGTEHAVSGVAAFGPWEWITLAVRISAVLAVIWAAVLAMRWYVARMSGEATGRLTRSLQIVETRSLGPSRALYLVRLGSRAVLIGATSERINALMEIDDPAQLESLFAGDGTPVRRAGRGVLPGL